MLFFADAFSPPLKGGYLVVYFVVFFGGVILGCLLDFFKKTNEIKQLKAQVIDTVAQTILRVQAARSEFIATQSGCSAIARSMIEAIQGEQDIESIRKMRERLCGGIFDSVLPKYLNYCELNHNFLKDDRPGLLAFAQDDLIFELRRISDWLKIINNQIILDRLDQVPARVSKQTLLPYRKFTNGLKRADRKMLEIQLSKVCGELIGE